MEATGNQELEQCRGGNVKLTESVPPDTKVFLKKPELIFRGNHIKGARGKTRER